RRPRRDSEWARLGQPRTPRLSASRAERTSHPRIRRPTQKVSAASATAWLRHVRCICGAGPRSWPGESRRLHPCLVTHLASRIAVTERALHCEIASLSVSTCRNGAASGQRERTRLCCTYTVLLRNPRPRAHPLGARRCPNPPQESRLGHSCIPVFPHRVRAHAGRRVTQAPA